MAGQYAALGLVAAAMICCRAVASFVIFRCASAWAPGTNNIAGFCIYLAASAGMHLRHQAGFAGERV